MSRLLSGLLSFGALVAVSYGADLLIEWARAHPNSPMTAVVFISSVVVLAIVLLGWLNARLRERRRKRMQQRTKAYAGELPAELAKMSRELIGEALVSDCA